MRVLRYGFFLLLFLLSFSAEARRPIRARAHRARPVRFDPATWDLPDAGPKPPPPNQVLLTFDDGPRKHTLDVLALLEQHQRTAIFFVNGHFLPTGVSCSSSNQTENTPALCADILNLQKILKKTQDQGHVIGNHAVSHFNLCSTKYVDDPELVKFEILDNARRIKDILGKEPTFFRIPFGSRCPSLTGKDGLLAELKIHHTGWDVDSQDWHWHDARKTFLNIVHALYQMPANRKAPVIILMHDTDPTHVEALRLLLEWADQVNKQHPGTLQFVDPHTLLPTPPLVEDVRFIATVIGQALTRLAASLFPGRPLLSNE